METPALEEMQEAVYPLTLFDNLTGGMIIVMGWLVEGTLDADRLEHAVDSVVTDWKALGGRLEKNEGLYQMRVPLDTYPAGYKGYTVTSQISAKPLSHYVSLPLGLSHDPLPSELFKHPDTPRTLSSWIDDSFPLLAWHVTHFPATATEGAHSCVGVTFPHVAFDGMGIASIVHAIEAELLGNKQPIRGPELHQGINRNPLLIELDKAMQRRNEATDNSKYTAIGLISFWWIVLFSAWSYWQAIWHEAKYRMLIVPPGAVKKLVEDVRRELVQTKGDNAARLTKGDVLAGFLFKACPCLFLASQPSAMMRGRPEATFRMCNLASLRRFFDGELSEYPHNMVIPMPYQSYTTRELQAISLPELAHQFAQVRREFTVEDVLRCYDVMLEGAATKRPVMFFDPNVTESSVLTNVCIANIANVNWTGAGAGRTLCRYKTSIRKPPLTKLTNIITLVGYLDDGSLVIQSNLTRSRFERLKEKIQKLVEEN